MPPRLDKAQLLLRLGSLLAEKGFARVASESDEPTAHAAALALAGLPHYEQLWAGDLRSVVALVAVVSGERVAGAELAERAQLLARRCDTLAARVGGPVQALQLALYDRGVPQEEREFVLREARKSRLVPPRGKVATWLFAMSEPALHAGRFPGWPSELSAAELRKLLVSPAA